MDSESYSQPTQATDEHFTLLFSHISKHASKWKEIGLNLGFLPRELDIIRQGNPVDGPTVYLSKMLSDWLQWAPGDGRGSKKSATIEDLLAAMYKTTGLGATADELGNIFNLHGCTSELLPISTDEHCSLSTKRSKEYAKQLDIANQQDEEIQSHYSKFMVAVRKLLIEKNVSPDDLLFVTSLDKRNIVTDEMKAAKTAKSFMSAFAETQSWSDFKPTVSLAREYGGEDGESLVRKYEKKLKKNLKHRVTTSLGSRCRVKTARFIFKLNEQEKKFTIHDTVKLRALVRRMLKIPPEELVLKGIGKGCVEVTFLYLVEAFSLDFAENVLKTYSSELEENRVISVTIKGKRVWSKSQKAVGEVSPHQKTMLDHMQARTFDWMRHVCGYTTPKRLIMRSVQPRARQPLKSNLKRYVIVLAIASIIVLLVVILFMKFKF